MNRILALHALALVQAVFGLQAAVAFADERPSILFIFTDNHGWYDKRWMYEESLKMPFIVKWPGTTEPGSVNSDLIQNLDYAETFLDLAGAEIPADMQGRSLVPLLKGQRPAEWQKKFRPGNSSRPRL